MESDLDLQRGPLEEQPLSADEKQLLSEYFQLEGRRQFENVRSLQLFERGHSPGLFELLNVHHELFEELSDKKLSLELSQREHWINLMGSIHEQFYQRRPSRAEVMLWTLIALEKHAIVQLKTGQEEFKPLLRQAQHQQLPLVSRLGESTSRQLTRNIDLFYSLLDIEGLTSNLIGLY